MLSMILAVSLLLVSDGKYNVHAWTYLHVAIMWYLPKASFILCSWNFRSNVRFNWQVLLEMMSPLAKRTTFGATTRTSVFRTRGCVTCGTTAWTTKTRASALVSVVSRHGLRQKIARHRHDATAVCVLLKSIWTFSISMQQNRLLHTGVILLQYSVVLVTTQLSRNVALCFKRNRNVSVE